MRRVTGCAASSSSARGPGSSGAYAMGKITSDGGGRDATTRGLEVASPSALTSAALPAGLAVAAASPFCRASASDNGGGGAGGLSAPAPRSGGFTGVLTGDASGVAAAGDGLPAAVSAGGATAASITLPLDGAIASASASAVFR